MHKGPVKAKEPPDDRLNRVNAAQEPKYKNESHQNDGECSNADDTRDQDP
jgi:hypothetical protein